MAQKSFGDSATIRILCEYFENSKKPLTHQQGWVWLEVGGKSVGNPRNPEALEEIGIGVGSLIHAASRTGRRSNPAVSKLCDADALKLVFDEVHGENITEEKLDDYIVLSANCGPAFDHWRGILVETGEEERFIWCHAGESVSHGHTVPLGTFWNVAEEARIWLHSS